MLKYTKDKRRTCLRCGTHFMASKEHRSFCCVEHRKDYNKICRQHRKREIDRLAKFILRHLDYEIGRGDPQNGESAVDVAIRLMSYCQVPEHRLFKALQMRCKCPCFKRER